MSEKKKAPEPTAPGATAETPAPESASPAPPAPATIAVEKSTLLFVVEALQAAHRGLSRSLDYATRNREHDVADLRRAEVEAVSQAFNTLSKLLPKK